MPRVMPMQESALADAAGELIPEDEYWDVRIEDVKEVESKSKDNAGKPMYQIRVRIMDDGPARNRSLVTSVCLWDGAHYSLVQLNKSIGLPTKLEQDGVSGLYIPDINELVGATTAIKVKHNLYLGETRANVDRFLEQKGAKKPASRASGKVGLTAPPRRQPGRVAPAAEAVESVEAEAPAEA
jgi:hypothetical protein